MLIRAVCYAILNSLDVLTFHFGRFLVIKRNTSVSWNSIYACFSTAVLPYELDGTCLPSGFLWKGQFCRKKMNYLWWVNLPDISLDITEWKCDYAFITWHSKGDQHYPHKEWTYEIITASFFLEVPGVIFSISCKALCFDRLLPLRNKYSKWLNLTGSPRTSDNNVALAHFTMFANEGQCKRLQSWAVWFIAHETFPQFG